MITIRVTEEDKKELELLGIGENGCKWFFKNPYYYKENEFGNWEIYSKSELPKRIREGIESPKYVYEA